MQAITTIGLDIAKSVFQVSGVDAEGNIVLRRQLKRRFVLAFFEKMPPSLVGIEACASSHHPTKRPQRLLLDEERPCERPAGGGLTQNPITDCRGKDDVPWS